MAAMKARGAAALPRRYSSRSTFATRLGDWSARSRPPSHACARPCDALRHVALEEDNGNLGVAVVDDLGDKPLPGGTGAGRRDEAMWRP